MLKIIDTIGKTHDTESIFSWDAFEMCSIDLTNFYSMLTNCCTDPPPSPVLCS